MHEQDQTFGAFNPRGPPAGYGNFGPQMISHEQTFGDTHAKAMASFRSQDRAEGSKGQPTLGKPSHSLMPGQISHPPKGKGHRRAETNRGVVLGGGPGNQAPGMQQLSGSAAQALSHVGRNRRDLFATLQVPTTEFENRVGNTIKNEKRLLHALPVRPSNQTLIPADAAGSSRHMRDKKHASLTPLKRDLSS